MARAMLIAAGRFHRPCSSSAISIASPCASRISRNGSSPRSMSAGRDPRATGLVGDHVERPDLHDPEAHLEQAAGQLRGLLLERPAGPRTGRPATGFPKSLSRARRASGRSRVRHRCCRRRCPGGPRHPAIWTSGCPCTLAGEVPQRDVDRGCPARLGADAAPAPVAVQRRPRGAGCRARPAPAGYGAAVSWM